MVIFYSVTIVKYVNDRENRRGNQEWKIQRRLQHWVVKNARETKGAIKNGQSRDTCNIGL
jgi:hypothetical protein